MAAARRSEARLALVGEWCGRFRQTLVYITYTGWDKYGSTLENDLLNTFFASNDILK